MRKPIRIVASVIAVNIFKTTLIVSDASNYTMTELKTDNFTSTIIIVYYPFPGEYPIFT